MPQYKTVSTSSLEGLLQGQKQRGWGVLIAMRDNIEGTVVPEFNMDCEIPWIKLTVEGSRPIYLCAYYRPILADEPSLQNFDRF